jgi:hypothetical protein
MLIILGEVRSVALQVQFWAPLCMGGESVRLVQKWHLDGGGGVELATKFLQGLLGFWREGSSLPLGALLDEVHQCEGSCG